MLGVQLEPGDSAGHDCGEHVIEIFGHRLGTARAVPVSSLRLEPREVRGFRLIGAPRFELGTSSPPDLSRVDSGDLTRPFVTQIHGSRPQAQ